MSMTIKGSGKGGGGGGGSESENTLKSKAIARIIDAISEGEIEGLANGERSIFLDGVPLENADGTKNFTGVSYQFVPGTQAQGYIEDFPDVENEIGVGVKVLKNTPVVRSVTNPNVNSVVVKIAVPQLVSNDDEGNMRGTEVMLAIDLQSSGQGYVEVKRDKISGKTMSTYERALKIPLTGNAPWNIRVRRITADSTSSKLQNDISFSSYTEVINAKLTYPNTAIVGLKIDSAQFSSVPVRGYDMKLLKVRIPDNYDPIARTYAGTWDGESWKIAWTNNPAWCLYDLLTNERYGLGDYIDPSAVDKWALYKISKYCDGLVPDGFGGMEPRFTLNCYLQAREEAYKLIGDICSVFRGMSYWSSGAITVSQDSPTDSTAIFTNANVIDGTFNYSGSSIKARHTVALVTWRDQNDMGKERVEYVEDEAGISRYGIVQTDVAAFGCTSRAQAHRLGKWILNSEREETEVVSFKAPIAAAALRPGSTIKVRDNYRFSNRMGGRIASATSTVVTLDSTVTLAPGTSYELSVMLPSGAMETRAVASFSGSTNSIIVASAFTATPQNHAVWILRNLTSSDVRTYRVVSLSEDGVDFEVTALRHDSSKYETIDGAVLLGDQSPVLWPPGTGGSGSVATIDVPSGLKATVSEYLDSGVSRNQVSFSWKHIDGLAGWELEYVVGKGNPVTSELLSQAIFDIQNADTGYYLWRVRAVSLEGRRSSWTAGNAFFVGSSSLTTPTALEAIPGFLQVRLRWTFPENKSQIVGSEIWFAPWPNAMLPVPTRLDASKLYSVSGTTNTFVHTDLDPTSKYVYWVRFALNGGGYGEMYPADGLVSGPKSDVSDVLDLLKDSFYASQFYLDLTSRIADIEAPSIDSILSQIGMYRIENAIDQLDSMLLNSVVADERIMNESATSIAALSDSFSLLASDFEAEAHQRELLTARFDDVSQDGTPTGKTFEALMLEDRIARANGDNAVSQQVNLVTSRLNDINGSGKTVEAVVAETKQSVVDETVARANAVDAVSARLDSGGDIQQAIVQAQNTASVKSANYRQATAPTTPALNDTWIDTANKNSLKVWNGSAWIASDNTDIGATASSVTSLQSRLNNVSGSGVSVESKLSTSASDITGLKGQYTLKIDTNGRVSGFGLANEAPVDDTPSSTFAIIADRFVIAPVGTSPNASSPFFYLSAPATIDGVPYPAGAYLKTAFIGDATVDTLKIAGNAVVVPSGATGIYNATTTINMSHPGYIMAVGTFTQGSGKSGHVWRLAIGGVEVQSEFPQGATTGAMSGYRYVQAGSHTCYVSCDTSSGDGRCGIIVFGIKR